MISALKVPEASSQHNQIFSKKEGLIIFHSFFRSTQLLLRGAKVLYSSSHDRTYTGGTLRIECDRMKAESIYRSVAELIKALRSASLELAATGLAVSEVEIYDTDSLSRFVQFSIYDDRFL